MHDFSDVDLDRVPIEPDVGDRRPGREKWIALGVILLLVAGLVGYSWYQRTRPVASAPTAAAVTEPDINLKPSAPVLEGERIPLPPLPESDPLVRDLISRLSTHPQILAWLATKGLIENFAVVTLNISEG